MAIMKSTIRTAALSAVIAMIGLSAGTLAANAVCLNKGKFENWLADYKKDARAAGISQRTIDRALSGMTLDKGVISRDRRQGFFAQSFSSFSKKLATDHRLKAGRRAISKHKKYFDRAEREYGVPAPVITGFWALESDFGVGMGKLPVLRSLATLAYDCRRGPMFREELTAALKIIDRGDLTPEDMIGSWAGELGQTQFLPQHYLNHAVDYDGNDHPNLFKSPGDIIGSTAAYLSHLGWKRGQPWIQEVRVPAELPWDQADLAIKHPRSKWAGWGVRAADGGALKSDGLPASLLLPMGRLGPAFLAYENFDIYLQWNQSLNYATTAAYLATRIDGAGTMRGRDKDIPGLDVEQTKQLQRILNKRGYDVGKIDGIIGAKTRAAVKEMQQKFGLPADSFPTVDLLRRL